MGYRSKISRIEHGQGEELKFVLSSPSLSESIEAAEFLRSERLKRIAEINQGLTESEYGSTGTVGQAEDDEELNVEDLGRRKPKETKKTGVPYDGDS